MNRLSTEPAKNQNDKLFKCFKQLHLSDDSVPGSLNTFANTVTQKKLAKGELLFSQNEKARGLFFIQSGRVKLSKKLVEGNELVLDIRKPGDLIGENLFSTEVYPVSATALKDCRICVFSKYDVEQLILDNPTVGLQVIRNLSDLLTSFFDRATSLAITKIEDRLYGVLRNVAQDHGITRSRGVEIQFPFTHKELAFLTGAHWVSVTRALSSLEKAGKIILENNTLTVTNLHI